MLPNWHDASYLQTGSPRQRSAFRALTRLRALAALRAHDAVLAGTIPLNIDIENSDLDIICEAHDLTAFTQLVTEQFERHAGFAVEQKIREGIPRVVARFRFADFPVEIFAQPVPVRRQRAFRHMVVEARLLALGGEAARQSIRAFKQSGLKTEPAFARYFGISGDPYLELLRLGDLDDEGLKKAMHLK